MKLFAPLVALASLFGVASCLQVGSTGTTDAGSTTTGGGASDAATGANDASDAAPTGTGCIVDPSSGVTLCTRISPCPDIAVDHDVYPNCGFRLPAASLEVDCLCGTFLCPLGAALTCPQMRDLLDTQSEGIACLQVSEGRCAETNR